MRKHQTTITFIFSLILALVVIGVDIFFYIIIKNKNQHTSAVLTTLENNILKKQNATLLTQQIAAVEETHTLINSYFVNPTQIDEFVNYLENIGIQANTKVKVESVAVIPLIKNTMAVKISAEGEFSDVIRTFKLLENAPYKIQIGPVYLNQRLLQRVTEDVKGVQTTKEVSLWHIDISFTILMS